MSSRVLISWGIFIEMGEFLGQNWGNKEAILLGDAAFIRLLQKSFWP